MNRTRKYLIILLTLLTALLCAVGASTWIISSPTSFEPHWAENKQTPVYIKRVLEADYTESGINLTDISDKEKVSSHDLKFEFYDPTAKQVIDLTSSIQITYSLSVSNGTDLKVEKNTVTVGSTYQISGVTINIDDQYAIVGTYPDVDHLEGWNQNQASNDYIYLDGSYATFRELLFKYKTVDVNGTLYTIEDALAQNGNATVKHDTSFAGTSVASLAGYSMGNGNYTVSSGETLLLPYSAEDTTGFHAGGEEPQGMPSAYSPVRFLSLTVPNQIELKNEGTLVVGGLTGRTNTEKPQGGISGGYAELVLSGEQATLVSTNTLKVYGNITGTGIVNATNGTVLERMEIVDWPGGSSAAGRFMGDWSQWIGSSIGSGLNITADNPNEFPFEDYKLQAINGPTLSISSGTVYQGDVRIYTGEKTAMGITIKARLSVAELTIVGSTSGTNGLFRLKNGSTFEKKVEKSREVITISNGFEGGYVALNMTVAPATVQMSTAKIKFPIPSHFDLILSGGDSTSAYGYEFMDGATLQLTEKAKFTATNTEDGIICYGNSEVKVGANCSLTLQGKFGGNITGSDSAVLNFSATNSNTGYIGGTGTFNVQQDFLVDASLVTTFTGTVTTVNAHGMLGQAGGKGDGNFVQNVTYNYLQGAWRAPTSYTINYHANGENVTGITGESISQIVNNDVLLGAAYSDWASKVTSPNVSRTHYNFGGWTFFDGTPVIDADGELINATVTVLGGGQLDLYAKWTPKDYNITYDMDNYVGEAAATGDPITNENPATFNIESTIQLQEPKDGELVFDAWYLDDSFTTSVNSINGQEILKDKDGSYTGLTLYGRWYPAGTEAFTVTYHYNSDEYADSSSETVLSTNTSWKAPDLTTKNSDTTYQRYFVGWFTDSGCTEKFSGTLTGDTDLYAKWENKTQVIFKADEVNGKSYEYSAGWYYGDAAITVPNTTTMQFSDYYNAVYATNDEDVTFDQYFYGWTVNGKAVEAGGVYTLDQADKDAYQDAVVLKPKLDKKYCLTIVLKVENYDDGRGMADNPGFTLTYHGASYPKSYTNPGGSGGSQTFTYWLIPKETFSTTFIHGNTEERTKGKKTNVSIERDLTYTYTCKSSAADWIGGGKSTNFSEG